MWFRPRKSFTLPPSTWNSLRRSLAMPCKSPEDHEFLDDRFNFESQIAIARQDFKQNRSWGLLRLCSCQNVDVSPCWHAGYANGIRTHFAVDNHRGWTSQNTNDDFAEDFPYRLPTFVSSVPFLPSFIFRIFPFHSFAFRTIESIATVQSLLLSTVVYRNYFISNVCLPSPCYYHRRYFALVLLFALVKFASDTFCIFLGKARFTSLWWKRIKTRRIKSPLSIEFLLRSAFYLQDFLDKRHETSFLTPSPRVLFEGFKKSFTFFLARSCNAACPLDILLATAVSTGQRCKLIFKQYSLVQWHFEVFARRIPAGNLRVFHYATNTTSVCQSEVLRSSECRRPLPLFRYRRLSQFLSIICTRRAANKRLLSSLRISPRNGASFMPMWKLFSVEIQQTRFLLGQRGHRSWLRL